MTRQRLNLLPILLFSAFSLGMAPALAAAQTIDVAFEATPLFLNADVKPGDSTARTVTVTNTGDSTEDLYVSVENTFTTGLDEVMELVVSDGQTTHFAGTFAEFFAVTPLALLTIAPNSTQVYTFTASLASTVGNEYQETQLGFDLVIGFAGGERVTDTPRRGGGGGSPAGSGGNLIVSNEDVVVTGNDVVITWNTNLPATSYVVCGPVSETPLVLMTTAPLFGYTFMIPETTNLVTNHSLSETNLAPGQYECRPASRESTDDLFSVGDPVNFSIGAVLGESLSAPQPTPFLGSQPMTGSVLGYGKGTFGAPTYDEWRAELDAQRAAEFKRAELEVTPGSTTMDSVATGTTEEVADTWSNRLRTNFNWWILVFLGVLLGGFGWTYRRSGR